MTLRRKIKKQNQKLTFEKITKMINVYVALLRKRKDTLDK